MSAPGVELIIGRVTCDCERLAEDMNIQLADSKVSLFNTRMAMLVWVGRGYAQDNLDGNTKKTKTKGVTLWCEFVCVGVCKCAHM